MLEVSSLWLQLYYLTFLVLTGSWPSLTLSSEMSGRNCLRQDQTWAKPFSWIETMIVFVAFLANVLCISAGMNPPGCHRPSWDTISSQIFYIEKNYFKCKLAGSCLDDLINVVGTKAFFNWHHGWINTGIFFSIRARLKRSFCWIMSHAAHAWILWAKHTD